MLAGDKNKLAEFGSSRVAKFLSAALTVLRFWLGCADSSIRYVTGCAQRIARWLHSRVHCHFHFTPECIAVTMRCLQQVITCLLPANLSSFPRHDAPCSILPAAREFLDAFIRNRRKRSRRRPRRSRSRRQRTSGCLLNDFFAPCNTALRGTAASSVAAQSGYSCRRMH